MNDNQLRDLTREFLEALEGGSYDDAPPQSKMLNEQRIPPQPGAEDAAQTALNSFQQLLNLLSAAEEKAAEMYELIQVPGSGDAMAGAFGAHDQSSGMPEGWSEAGEIVDHLERVFEAAGYSADGTTLKEFL